ncbi:MAG TPA: PilZ domain-containing protein [Polyangiaceae bacterium]|nr:PilZ domain-containing protein [Polyangiaceae bacterium]
MHEKRNHARVPLNVTVSCERPDGEKFSAVSTDISIGGMFLQSEVEVPHGIELVIVAKLPGAKQELKLPAVVRWVKPGGFGVQFGLLGAVDTHAISQLMRG